MAFQKTVFVTTKYTMFRNSNYTRFRGSEHASRLEYRHNWHVISESKNAEPSIIYKDRVFYIKPNLNAAEYRLISARYAKPFKNGGMHAILIDDAATTFNDSYWFAKFFDFENFIGVTFRENEIRVYERLGGSWNLLIGGIDYASAVGKKIAFMISDDQVELFIDDVSVGTATHTITGDAFFGIIERQYAEKNEITPILQDYTLIVN